MSTMGFNFRCKKIFATAKHSNSLGRNTTSDHLLLVSSSILSTYNVNQRYFLQLIYVESISWAKFFVGQRCDLKSILFYIVDGAQFSVNNGITVQFNCNNMTTDLRLNVYTSIEKFAPRLSTVSLTYQSVSWLERELSDFTNIFFQNSPDTRRLLLDYFQPKQDYPTHISNERSYSNLYYEVILNY